MRDLYKKLLKYLGVSHIDIISKRRQKDIVTARKIIAYKLFQIEQVYKMDLARLLKKDSSSIWYYINNISEEDKKLVDEYNFDIPIEEIKHWSEVEPVKKVPNYKTYTNC